MTIEQITNIENINNMSEETGDVTIILSDGTKVLMPVRLALYNGLLWGAYVSLGVPVTTKRIFWIKGFDGNTTADCINVIYNELVLDLNIHHMDVLAKIWFVKNNIFSFSYNHSRSYQASISALSLCRLFNQEPLQKIINQTLDPKLGTRTAEKKMELVNTELHKALQDPNLLHDNVLAPFMKTKLLKRNQLPQMFAMYGCRSDITDEMMMYPISASAMGGLENVQDFATESLSAKKAAFFNSEVIESAQYFARKCRLVGSQLPTLYKGWCGSQVTIPIVINPAYKKNFLGKYIKLPEDKLDLLKVEPRKRYNDNSIRLTPENIDIFAGTTVDMWSPFGCKHTDGVCEHCAGYMYQRLEAYTPPGIHLGVYSATKAVSAVTQLILSAKHLIKTLSKEYNLPQYASRYFSKNGDALIWQSHLADKLKGAYVRINLNSIGPISDLTRSSIPAGETFSNVDRVEIVRDNEVVDILELSDGTTKPYLSNYTLQFMRKIYKKLKITPDTVDIPLDEFDFAKSLLRFKVVNDDMVSFVASVENFLSTQIKEYHSVPLLIKDFSNLLYSKTGIEIFYVEMMLKGFLITDQVDYRIPVLDKGDQYVNFGGLGPVITEAALSTKLSFERMEMLFSEVRAVLYDRGSGYGFNDRFFNF